MENGLESTWSRVSVGSLREGRRVGPVFPKGRNEYGGRDPRLKVRPVLLFVCVCVCLLG